MGYDSFGLPAEQYAIQTGQRPEDTTSVNIDGGFDKEGNKIAGYRKQLDKIGFHSIGGERTSNPDYYKHTQWILFSYLILGTIKTTIRCFNFDFNFRKRNATVNAVCDDKIAVLRQVTGCFLQEQQERILYNIG
jgi:leucyl-tRNA synthetase